MPEKLTAIEAVGRIPDGARVMLTPGSGETQTLLEALVAAKDIFFNLKLIGGMMLGEHYPWLDPGMERHFRYTNFHMMPCFRDAVRAGRADYLPMRYSQIVRTLTAGGPLPCDVAMIQVTPPDADGRCSLGPSVSYPLPVAVQAPLVIAEMNARCPRTLGNSVIHADDIDIIVEADRPLREYRAPRVGDIERAIARNVAALVPDGALIQIGVGNVPEAILEALEGHRDLGAIAVMIDRMVDLFESGVINNKHNKEHPGVADMTELMGTEKLWEFVNENPAIFMRTPDFTHNACRYYEREKFVSINGALEVDLTGQVNAETVRGLPVGAVGGQFDFVVNSWISDGGVSIIALPSTAGEGGKHSRIVPALAPGAAVTTPRHIVRYVVTEHGAADLWGKTPEQRAEALTALAHPDFRDDIWNRWEDFKRI